MGVLYPRSQMVVDAPEKCVRSRVSLAGFQRHPSLPSRRQHWREMVDTGDERVSADRISDALTVNSGPASDCQSTM